MDNKKKPNQTQSFEQLVGNANREALKPFIIEQIEVVANDIYSQISQKLFGQLQAIQTRAMAYENILGFLGYDKASLEIEIFNVEDKATGHKLALRPAQNGDLLRIVMWTKTPSETEFMRETKREVLNLGTDSEKSLQTKALNDALLGMQAGESKEIMIETVAVKLMVQRVSEPIAPPVPEVKEV